jgi:hypothetical protein
MLKDLIEVHVSLSLGGGYSLRLVGPAIMGQAH